MYMYIYVLWSMRESANQYQTKGLEGATRANKRTCHSLAARPSVRKNKSHTHTVLTELSSNAFSLSLCWWDIFWHSVCKSHIPYSTKLNLCVCGLPWLLGRRYRDWAIPCAEDMYYAHCRCLARFAGWCLDSQRLNAGYTPCSAGRSINILGLLHFLTAACRPKEESSVMGNNRDHSMSQRPSTI